MELYWIGELTPNWLVRGGPENEEMLVDEGKLAEGSRRILEVEK